MVPEELLSMFKELSMDGKLPHILERTTQENTEASLQLARLQREKEWLELRLTKRRKDIQLERSQVEALGQQISAIERKLQWVEKKNEFVAETAKERRQADVVRRQRGKQVKGLLRALNRESRLQVERDILVGYRQEAGGETGGDIRRQEETLIIICGVLSSLFLF
ncbi:hypothetical protein, conserved [Eimeria maxima]|uniref:Uncharacterized protein n=1 Tax=Eimeria maxima TaxID=5804 RepID=U6M1J2_EIMMA|nr:hypothetical protein, conserved [Eimeria maxima]CDJ56963.1 hypothetical protein, conserved [Eimeria maxima]